MSITTKYFTSSFHHSFLSKLHTTHTTSLGSAGSSQVNSGWFPCHTLVRKTNLLQSEYSTFEYDYVKLHLASICPFDSYFNREIFQVLVNFFQVLNGIFSKTSITDGTEVPPKKDLFHYASENKASSSFIYFRK